jgi:beta-glucosidase
LLQARLVVPEIRALQAHPVQASLKHYIVNNQEYKRATLDVRIDERTLEEIYLPPFTAGVQAGRVASVMGAYPKVNGTFGCENPYTLTTILREQLGFRGWVINDFGANHRTVESANAGLDMELGGPKSWGAPLLAAVHTGQVSAARIDEMVRRILRPMVGLGLFDHPVAVRPFPVQQHGAVARLIGEQGIVLLKNQAVAPTGVPLLPLSSQALRSIAVIGPDADNAAAAGGGSGRVQLTYTVSVLEGIRRRAGEGVRVDWAPGTDRISVGVMLPGPPAIPSAVLTPADAAHREHGLRAEYWPNPSFAGEPAVVRTEAQLNLNLGFFTLPRVQAVSPQFPPPPDVGDKISVRWTGSLTIPASGDYLLSLTSLGSARLYLDGQLLIDASRSEVEKAADSSRWIPQFVEWGGWGAQVHTATLPLIAGEVHTVGIEYAADLPEQSWIYGAQVRFGWQPPADVVAPWIAEAAARAGRSDVAIVVVRDYNTEGWDRPSLRLPNEQDRLIRAVTAANPRTVVVLTAGGAVETASWEDSTPAVLQAWYTGQEQGSAIARVLFGDVNPGGKLPITFPRSEDQTPVATPAQYPGIDGVVHYSEGIFVGYRGYDQFGIEPQYPFGYGLSYTTFAYSEFQLTPEMTDGKAAIRVRFMLTNTGSRAGTEIAQVYLGLPAAVGAPPKRLVGWARVPLELEGRQQVTVTLDPQSAERPLSYWNADTHGWEIATGDYQVYVGASSRDIRLTGTFRVERIWDER